MEKITDVKEVDILESKNISTIRYTTTSKEKRNIYRHVFINQVFKVWVLSL